MTLSPAREGSEDVKTPVAVYGLKLSAFMWESADRKRAPELAQEWLTDCLGVLRPKRVTILKTKYFHAYHVEEVAQVTEALIREYPAISDFRPTGEKGYSSSPVSVS